MKPFRSAANAYYFLICHSYFFLLQNQRILSGPTLVSPGNKSANVPTNQVFTCSSSSSVITYQFIFTDVTNSSLSFSSPVQISNTYAPTQLVSGHTYTWSVSVYSSYGTLAVKPGPSLYNDL
jgi:hypothetical protein